MPGLATISATCLNQFALDFEGNYQRILESIRIAKAQGSKFRCGPELEICGYNCEDHFYETDTTNHSWEVLEQLINHEICQDILVDVGMPVMHNGIMYNCRIIFFNRKLYLIRPKFVLCDDGNYRESRWFTAWSKKRFIEDYVLPEIIFKSIGQKTVPFGDALIQLNDTRIGFEICEELWSPRSTHIDQILSGAEIIINGSGSHAEIRKASYALELIKSATSKCGGLYIFNNLRGCDGERVYLNGSSNIVLNGKPLIVGEQYSLLDVEVITAAIHLDDIRIYKNSIRSRNFQADAALTYPHIPIDWSLTVHPTPKNWIKATPPLPTDASLFCCPEEEIARGPALWLWDYLRRSPASGFFLPLSGGVDSSSVAIIVYSMCKQIYEFIEQKNSGFETVLRDLRKVVRDETYVPISSYEICNKIFTTCYMGSENSSIETRQRADGLAKVIRSNHMTIDITPTVNSFIVESTKALGGQTPSYSGTRAENLALQNIQARSRMVYAYLLAQLSPWSQKQNGFLLVLGSSNVDEAIRGYFTKYDCSAADLNPIGGISKTDLKNFILYAGKKFGFKEIAEIVEAPPTAELQPLESKQTDEADMGMTYDELSYFGRLRKPNGCGPFSMVARLLHLWKDQHDPREIAAKVKHFYTAYAANRHKMTILTPACHMESYGPEDHRYDLRPMFYPMDFTWQFRKIDEYIKSVSDESEVD